MCSCLALYSNNRGGEEDRQEEDPEKVKKKTEIWWGLSESSTFLAKDLLPPMFVTLSPSRELSLFEEEDTANGGGGATCRSMSTTDLLDSMSPSITSDTDKLITKEHSDVIIANDSTIKVQHCSHSYKCHVLAWLHENLVSQPANSHFCNLHREVQSSLVQPKVARCSGSWPKFKTRSCAMYAWMSSSPQCSVPVDTMCPANAVPRSWTSVPCVDSQ